MLNFAHFDVISQHCGTGTCPCPIDKQLACRFFEFIIWILKFSYLSNQYGASI